MWLDTKTCHCLREKGLMAVVETKINQIFFQMSSVTVHLGQNNH